MNSATDLLEHELTSMPLKQTRIGFRVHPDWPVFVLPVGVASQLEMSPAMAPVPNVKHWLRGVLNLRGNLVPVFDVAQWHGNAPLPSSRHVLVISPGNDAVAVLCSAPPVLLSIESSEPLSADDAMYALAEAKFNSEAGYVYQFDARLWLQKVARNVLRTAEM